MRRRGRAPRASLRPGGRSAHRPGRGRPSARAPRRGPRSRRRSGRSSGRSPPSATTPCSGRRAMLRARRISARAPPRCPRSRSGRHRRWPAAAGRRSRRGWSVKPTASSSNAPRRQPTVDRFELEACWRCRRRRPARRWSSGQGLRVEIIPAARAIASYSAVPGRVSSERTACSSTTRSVVNRLATYGSPPKPTSAIGVSAGASSMKPSAASCAARSGRSAMLPEVSTTRITCSWSPASLVTLTWRTSPSSTTEKAVAGTRSPASLRRQRDGGPQVRRFRDRRVERRRAPRRRPRPVR